MPRSDYQRAYESAKQELAQLIAQGDRMEQRKLVLRRTIEQLKELCENEKMHVEPSAEAAYLLENYSLSDEIKAIVSSQWPAWWKPLAVRRTLQELGHDLSKYTNPQATIHMMLKRMAGAGTVQEMKAPHDGKQMYRGTPISILIGLKTAIDSTRAGSGVVLMDDAERKKR